MRKQTNDHDRNRGEFNLSKLTVKKRAEFLDYLRDGWSITAAAAKIRVSRQAVYALRKSDDEFAKEWDDAYESGTDLYEDEAKRRAIQGTEKPVFYQGEVVGHIKEYSDTLLIVALKARRPEKYRENIKQEISAEVEHTHKVVRVPAKATKEEWPEILELKP